MWGIIASAGGWVLFGVLLVGWVRWSVLERNFFTKNGWRGRME